MYQIINSMPFEMYIIVLLIGFGCLIYGIYDMRKKQPGNPMIWFLPFAILADVALIVYKCAIDLTTNLILQKVTNVFVIISIILFVISLIVTFVIANKKNYTDPAIIKQVMPILKGCGIAIMIVAILLMILITLRNRQMI